jgi:hypothetical protein
MAAEHVMHIQKALDQMNLQIHRVLSDITGVSGLRILDAILEGKRDPVALAQLCDGASKAARIQWPRHWRATIERNTSLR